MKRDSINATYIEQAVEETNAALCKQLIQKGDGAFISTHEALGIIAEEYDELKDAVRSNNIEDVKKELLDIIVAAQFTVVCINQGVIR